MTYGATAFEIYKSAAEQVAKVLGGARPSELPLRGATRFELVINNWPDVRRRRSRHGTSPVRTGIGWFRSGEERKDALRVVDALPPIVGSRRSRSSG
jgi:hypothetical protein